MTDNKLNFLIALFLVTSSLVIEVYCLVELTNVQCESLDKNFCDFEYCYIKSVNRTFKYLSGKLKFFQIPITTVKINIGVYKRLNGYKPFLYNITIDGCKFLKTPSSNPVASFIYDFIKDVSNVNHSCPYNHDLVVDKMNVQHINHQVTAVLPVPKGSYMVQTNLVVHKITRAVTKVYGTLS
ncbi:uncharacterized protein LOC108145618 [Drosophila elegans]|uniref:uncharacterized protein LOC108145618 n=1 Tax=Drosophila elegans TaxID=30023 RepID=UPI0007E70F1C|nr:uncharacterized protein LOC108145618 [Drosophila elegans]